MASLQPVETMQVDLQEPVGLSGLPHPAMIVSAGVPEL